MSDLIRREDAIETIHNYWKKRLDTLPTKESEYGEVYADIQQMDKILEYNKTLCNFIEAIPSADRPQGEWIEVDDASISCRCSVCGWEAHLYEDDVYGMPYCPNCGCRMKGVDDDNA